MDRQSMAALQLAEVPDNFDPIESQRALQLHIPPYENGKKAETIGELLSRIRFNHEADAVEKVEMLDWLPWKSWKTHPDVMHDDPVDSHPAIITEVKFELIDRFHFMLNEAIALGMDWGEFLSIFQAKQLENRQRQERGY